MNKSFILPLNQYSYDGNIYNCIICNYSTLDSGNYCKHKHTKKHQDKIQEGILIESEKQKIKDMIIEHNNMIELIQTYIQTYI
jgi:hypothetical protein